MRGRPQRPVGVEVGRGRGGGSDGRAVAGGGNRGGGTTAAGGGHTPPGACGRLPPADGRASAHGIRTRRAGVARPPARGAPPPSPEGVRCGVHGGACGTWVAPPPAASQMLARGGPGAAHTGCDGGGGARRRPRGAGGGRRWPPPRQCLTDNPGDSWARAPPLVASIKNGGLGGHAQNLNGATGRPPKTL